MNYIPFALAGLMAATGACAQAAPPPPDAPPAPGAVAPPPPPPPGEPDARRPPPPPRGASIRFDRGPGFRLDLHCAEADTTRACADIAMQLAEKFNAPVQTK